VLSNWASGNGERKRTPVSPLERGPVDRDAEPASIVDPAREVSRVHQRQLAVMGGISLACWLTAITCGRMIAFW